MTPPAPPPRDLRLDIVRGWMQLSIFVSHATGTIFAWGIHAAWGLSDASEQFLFLSGFVLGSVFALKQARRGFAVATRDMLGRALRLWRTHMLVFFAFAALVLWAELGLPLPGEVAQLGWSWLVEAPWQAVPAAPTMLWQPAFMGILPVFVWCMVAAPAFLWLAGRAGAAALVLPFGLYAATQLTPIATPALGGTGIAFEPLAWQVLFLLGAFLGRRALLGGPPLPRHPALVAAAVAMLVFGVWFRLVEQGLIDGPALPTMPIVGKERLALPRLLHALALAYVVSILVPRLAAWMVAAPARALAAIGRQSLNVFCVGLFLSWGVTVAFRHWPEAAWWLDPLLVGAGCVALWGVARFAERGRARGAGRGRATPGAARQAPG